MALLTNKEFAKKIGIQQKHISLYIQRGTIVRRNDNLFDTGNAKNLKHIQKKKLKKSAKPESVESVTVIETEPIPDNSKVKDVKTTRRGYKNDETVNEKAIKQLIDYDKARAEKMKHDAELAKLKMQKLKGEVIPIDMAERIFTIHFNNISAEFYNVIDNSSIMMIEQLGGTREDLTKLRKQLKENLNSAIDESKKKSIQDIDEASKQFSEKKHRGENG